MTAPSYRSVSRAALDKVFTRTVRAIVADPRTTPDALFVLADALNKATHEADVVFDHASAGHIRLISALVAEVAAERVSAQTAVTNSGTEG